MLKIVHPVAGAVSLLLIAAFWGSTVLVELFGTTSQVTAVKTAIPWGFVVLVPALAVAGATGVVSSRGRAGGLVARKLRRMPVVAANGALVLIPAALFLSWKARAGELDATFYLVQALELTAGAANLTLLSLNMRDGLRMTGRLPRHARQSRGAAALPKHVRGDDRAAAPR